MLQALGTEREARAPEAHAIGLDAVLNIVSSTAGSAIDADAPLLEAGLDSLGAVELRNQLEQAMGDAVELPSNLLADFPTARLLADLLGPRAGEGGDGLLHHCTVVVGDPALLQHTRAVNQFDSLLHERGSRNFPSISRLRPPCGRALGAL